MTLCTLSKKLKLISHSMDSLSKVFESFSYSVLWLCPRFFKWLSLTEHCYVCKVASIQIDGEFQQVEICSVI